MQMQGRAIAIMLVVLVVLHVLSLREASEKRKSLPSDGIVSILLPSPVLKITSLEFKELASDLLFIRALIFDGSTYERKERPRMKAWEWQWLHQLFTASTDLDPYFFDPYFVANARLTWEGGMINETNALLEKGARYRDWDWMLPFFIGFNHFYFLRDNAAASQYLSEAAKRPGPSASLASLASRLAYKEKKTENAIIFLEVIARKTEDEKLKKEFETRLKALKIRLFLERAVVSYKQKYHALPSDINKLVTKGIITEIPADPYEGAFSLSATGEITATSDYQLIPHQKRQ
jgi:hypothetical protein